MNLCTKSCALEHMWRTEQNLSCLSSLTLFCDGLLMPAAAYTLGDSPISTSLLTTGAQGLGECYLCLGFTWVLSS